jgi:carbonic anhydrase
LSDVSSLAAVTGHYDCGAVKTALQKRELGLIDNWLRNIRDVARLYQVLRPDRLLMCEVILVDSPFRCCRMS